MPTDPEDRFHQANKLGDLALLRLRAEVLLERTDITAAEREELERIAVVPKLEDRKYLGSFDRLLEADEKADDDEF